MLRVRPNTILDPEKARAGHRGRQEAYEKKGYLDADIRYETDAGGRERGRRHLRRRRARAVRIQRHRVRGQQAVQRQRAEAASWQTKESWILSLRHRRRQPRPRGAQDRHRAPDRLLLRQRLHRRARRRAQGRARRGRAHGHLQDRRGRAVPLRQRSTSVGETLPDDRAAGQARAAARRARPSSRASCARTSTL